MLEHSSFPVKERRPGSGYFCGRGTSQGVGTNGDGCRKVTDAVVAAGDRGHSGQGEGLEMRDCRRWLAVETAKLTMTCELACTHARR
jgi:hypothetical protein